MWTQFLSAYASQNSGSEDGAVQQSGVGAPSNARDVFDASSTLLDNTNVTTPVNVVSMGVNLGSILLPQQEPSANGGEGLSVTSRMASALSGLFENRVSAGYVSPNYDDGGSNIWLYIGGFIVLALAIFGGIFLRR